MQNVVEPSIDTTPPDTTAAPGVNLSSTQSSQAAVGVWPVTGAVVQTIAATARRSIRRRESYAPPQEFVGSIGEYFASGSAQHPGGVRNPDGSLREMPSDLSDLRKRAGIDGQPPRFFVDSDFGASPETRRRNDQLREMRPLFSKEEHRIFLGLDPIIQPDRRHFGAQVKKEEKKKEPSLAERFFSTFNQKRTFKKNVPNPSQSSDAPPQDSNPKADAEAGPSRLPTSLEEKRPPFSTDAIFDAINKRDTEKKALRNIKEQENRSRYERLEQSNLQCTNEKRNLQRHTASVEAAQQQARQERQSQLSRENAASSQRNFLAQTVDAIDNGHTRYLKRKDVINLHRHHAALENAIKHNAIALGEISNSPLSLPGLSTSATAHSSHALSSSAAKRNSHVDTRTLSAASSRLIGISSPETEPPIQRLNPSPLNPSISSTTWDWQANRKAQRGGISSSDTIDSTGSDHDITKSHESGESTIGLHDAPHESSSSLPSTRATSSDALLSAPIFLGAHALRNRTASEGRQGTHSSAYHQSKAMTRCDETGLAYMLQRDGDYNALTGDFSFPVRVPEPGNPEKFVPANMVGKLSGAFLVDKPLPKLPHPELQRAPQQAQDNRLERRMPPAVTDINIGPDHVSVRLQGGGLNTGQSIGTRWDYLPEGSLQVQDSQGNTLYKLMQPSASLSGKNSSSSISFSVPPPASVMPESRETLAAQVDRFHNTGIGSSQSSRPQRTEWSQTRAKETSFQTPTGRGAPRL